MAEPTPSDDGEPRGGRLLAGRYELIQPIAAGGMAQVWEASDRTLARRVAVKLLHRHLAGDHSFVRRFRAEAVAAARLSHPSIVSVYDTFSADGVEGIVMELVKGTTLREDLDVHGPMRLEALLAVGTQVADALSVAHASGLVHRDVKPANILLAADGRVLVADFGIAKAAEGSDLTSAGAMVGTAKYLAPEQVEGGAIDARADLYALGVVLYEALTGTAPFVEDTDAATALARLHRDPIPPRQLRPEIPPAVEAVVLQAMAREPDHRFRSALALRTALISAGADPTWAPQAARAANAPATSTPPPRPVPAPPLAGPTSTGFAPPAAHGVPATDEQPAAPRRRRGSVVVLAAMAMVAIAGAFAMRGSADDPATGAPLAIAGAASFDPQGDNGAEREDLVELAIDGDPATAWRSEQYADPTAIAGKDGIGLIVRLDGAGRLGRLDVISPEGGWAAQVFVGTGDAPGDLAGWGDPVASAAGVDAGTTSFDLAGARGDRLLVWFTDLPASGVVQVSEAKVTAA